MMRLDSLGNELGSSGLPPLTDLSPFSTNKTKPVTESAYVPCFSNPIDTQTHRNIHQVGIFDSYTNFPNYGVSSNQSSDTNLPRIPSYHHQVPSSSLALTSSMYGLQDQSLLRALLENQESNRNNNFKAERDMISVSQETGLTTDMNPEISSVVPSLGMTRRTFDNHHHQQQQQQQPNATSAAMDHYEGLWTY